MPQLYAALKVSKVSTTQSTLTVFLQLHVVLMVIVRCCSSDN